MNNAVAYVCDAVRTPFGRQEGTLATVRTDDLAAVPIRALTERHPGIDWSAVDDVIYGCTNQAGEDRRNVARVAALLAGLPESVTGVTVNRSCGSGLEAVAEAARTIRLREGALFIAGGVDSMSRAPFILPKTTVAQARGVRLADTAFGWRFVNPLIQERFGAHSGSETAENVADEFHISRADQDAFAYRSQCRAALAFRRGMLREEIVPVPVYGKSSLKLVVERDEHPRPETTVDRLSELHPIGRRGHSVTDGNIAADGDGACALLVASHSAVRRFGLSPRARIIASAVAGVEPRIAGIGPVAAIRRVLERARVRLSKLDLIELNEASAAEALAVLRALGLADDAPFVNPNGGAIALGHPFAASGARLVATAVHQMQRNGARHALCATRAAMGQGMAMLLERV
jgi:3-oxoadipyl-CoA thiolase